MGMMNACPTHPRNPSKPRRRRRKPDQDTPTLYCQTPMVFIISVWSEVIDSQNWHHFPTKIKIKHRTRRLGGGNLTARQFSQIETRVVRTTTSILKTSTLSPSKSATDANSLISREIGLHKNKWDNFPQEIASIDVDRVIPSNRPSSAGK